VPLGPPSVALVGRAQQLGLEVGNAGKDLGPVLAGLLAAHECPVGMHRLLAAVVRVKAGDEGVQVVVVLGVAESLKHLSHQRPRLLKKVVSWGPTMDRRSWA
jgi:hypothetical protein